METHAHRSGLKICMSGQVRGISSGQKQPQSRKVCAAVQFALLMGQSHMHVKKLNMARFGHFIVLLHRQEHILSSNICGGGQTGTGVGQVSVCRFCGAPSTSCMRGSKIEIYQYYVHTHIIKIVNASYTATCSTVCTITVYVCSK